MANLKSVKAAAHKIGAEVEYTKEFGCYELLVTAPPGYCWEEELHQFVDSGYLPWAPDWADMLERMSYGVEKCETLGCEWCNSENE